MPQYSNLTPTNKTSQYTTNRFLNSNRTEKQKKMSNKRRRDEEGEREEDKLKIALERIQFLEFALNNGISVDTDWTNEKLDEECVLESSRHSDGWNVLTEIKATGRTMTWTWAGKKEDFEFPPNNLLRDCHHPCHIVFKVSKNVVNEYLAASNKKFIQSNEKFIRDLEPWQYIDEDEFEKELTRRGAHTMRSLFNNEYADCEPLKGESGEGIEGPHAEWRNVYSTNYGIKKDKMQK